MSIIMIINIISQKLSPTSNRLRRRMLNRSTSVGAGRNKNGSLLGAVLRSECGDPERIRTADLCLDRAVC